MQLNLSWIDFKTQIGNGGLPFKVLNIGGVYYLIASNDLFELDCALVQDGGASQTDYENNYASYAVAYSVSPLAPGSYRNVTGNTTVTVKSGAGVLMGVCINNNASGGGAILYDNTAGSGTKIANINFGSPSGGLLSTTGQPPPTGFTALNVRFATGLTVVTSGSSSNDITLIYR